MIIWIYILIDFAYDTVVRLFIGTICKPCAWLAIWAFKLPTIPFVIFGWAFRLMIESMGFMVSGWMLFFGGSGCFMRWGHNCWFAKRFKHRHYWEIMDLAWFIRNPSDYFVKDPSISFVDAIHEFFYVPKIEDFDTEVANLVGQRRRDAMLDSCPLNRKTIANAKDSYNSAVAYFGL